MSATSGLLCTAIVGGAVLPWIGGKIADASATLNPVFFVPLVGYVLLTVFAIAHSMNLARRREPLAA